MSAVLTYHVRAGQLAAAAAGKVFHLPTHRDASRVLAWEKVQEVRSGKPTLWDHCFEPPHKPAGHFLALPDGIAPEAVTWRVSLGGTSTTSRGLYDWPGEYAQRFDGVDTRPGMPHNHRGSVLYVGDSRAGVYIHGWPPCHLKGCIVVLQQWDDLSQAVASEAELSLAVIF